MTEVRVTLPGEVLLEGVLHLPAHGEPAGGVAVCHPHPEQGGDMENALVVAIARAVQARGLAALRFNFCGVGRSGGPHCGGREEPADVGAALTYLAGRIGTGKPLGLAGYSFGAVMAMAYAAGEAGAVAPGLRALAVVGLPLRMPELGLVDPSRLAGRDLPLLGVCGTEDHLCVLEELRGFFARLGGRARVVSVPGADHGYWGFHEAVARVVADFLAAALLGKSLPDVREILY